MTSRPPRESPHGEKSPSKIKIVYMGTSSFAVPTLVRLFEQGFSITAVVTQPDKPSGRGQSVHASPVKQKAVELHLPVYQPSTLKNESARTLFRSMVSDMIVVVAYGKILPPWLLELPRFGAINLHGSLLPQYRGAAPIHWAVANGETATGVCTMRVEEGLDTGPIYLCRETSIGPEETVPHLSERLAIIGAELMLQTIEGIAAGELQPKVQDHARATLAPILRKQHGYIDWSGTATHIHNRTRAFNPWPGTVTRFRGTTCKILRTGVVDEYTPGDPGTILAGRFGLRVICGEGTLLQVFEIQPENRKAVSGKDFANGNRIRPGEKFEPLLDN